MSDYPQDDRRRMSDDFVERVSANVCVDDVIAYVGEGRARLSEPPAAESRSWLRVSRVDEDGIHGYRVNPQEWERDVEYVIVPAQIESNGVIFRA